MTHSLKDLRTIAAKLVGAAIKSLFPKAYLVGGEATDYGFYYDFILENESLDAQGLVHLEERMRDFTFKGVYAVTTEMVRDNAAAFLKHQHQPYLSAQVTEFPSGLVQLIKIENFADLCSAEFDGSLNTIGVFKLLDVEEREVSYPGMDPVRVIHVTGTLFPSQQDLKEYLKKARDAKKYSHDIVGKQLGLFHFDDAGRCFWTPKGVKLKKLVTERWMQVVATRGCAVIETPIESVISKRTAHKAYAAFSLPGARRLAELFLVKSSAPQHQQLGLWRPPFYLKDEVRCFCAINDAKNELISSLQFITEIYNILGSGFNWRVGGNEITSKKQKTQSQPALALLTEAMQSCGIPFLLEEGGEPKATLYLTDCYGKPWAGPSIALEIDRAVDGKQPDEAAVVMSLWGSLERFIAWLLEHRHEAPEKENVVEIRSDGKLSEERFVGIDKLLQQLS